MVKYKTINGWIKALKKLAQHPQDLKGFEELSEESKEIFGALFGAIDNGVAEFEDSLEKDKK